VLYADEVNLEKASQNIGIARANLANILNTSQAQAMTPATPLAPIGSWTHSLEQTIRASEAYRKVIEQRLLDVKTNQAQAQIYLATYRPTLQLVNTLYWTKGAGYTSVGPDWVQGARSDLWNGSSLLQLTFTGFDGGQARMNAESSVRKAKAAMETYQATVNDVRRDAQASFAQAEAGRRIVLSAANGVHQANEAIRLQALRFRAGYGTATDVVQAQQNLAQSVISYIDNLSTYNKTLLTLSRNTGLDYAPDPELLKQVGEPLNLLRLPSVIQSLR
jgi:outer membrane protein TolC